MDEYEPLKSLIDLTTNKKNTILYFLSDTLKNKLKEYELCNDGEFYLNDYVVGIKKNNLDKDFIGKIVCNYKFPNHTINWNSNRIRKFSVNF